MMNNPAPLMHLLIAAIMAVVLSVGASVASAAEASKHSWMPTPPKAKAGTKCDEDPGWMRKWHMKKLQHKRDQTMRHGVRTDKYSLKRCITCHAVKGDKGEYLTVKDKRHFCRSCHDYAAVKIDCFGCHASRPGSGGHAAIEGADNPHIASKHSSSGMATAMAELQKHFAGESQ